MRYQVVTIYNQKHQIWQEFHCWHEAQKHANLLEENIDLDFFVLDTKVDLLIGEEIDMYINDEFEEVMTYDPTDLESSDLIFDKTEGYGIYYKTPACELPEISDADRPEVVREIEEEFGTVLEVIEINHAETWDEDKSYGDLEYAQYLDEVQWEEAFIVKAKMLGGRICKFVFGLFDDCENNTSGLNYMPEYKYYLGGMLQ